MPACGCSIRASSGCGDQSGSGVRPRRDRRAAGGRAARHPAAGAFGPLITTPEGVVYPSARHLPSIGPGRRARPVRLVVADESVDPAVPAGRGGTGRADRRLAVRVLPAVAALGVRRRSTGSTRATSCTSRTSTSVIGWPGPAGRASTARPRGRRTTAATPPNGRPRRWPQAHHRSAYRYLSGRYSGAVAGAAALVLRAGLGGRAFLPGGRPRSPPARSARHGDVARRGRCASRAAVPRVRPGSEPSGAGAALTEPHRRSPRVNARRESEGFDRSSVRRW